MPAALQWRVFAVNYKEPDADGRESALFVALSETIAEGMVRVGLAHVYGDVPDAKGRDIDCIIERRTLIISDEQRFKEFKAKHPAERDTRPYVVTYKQSDVHQLTPGRRFRESF